MIQLSHLYKTYPGPTHALRNIDLEIQKGEFVFITGHSGAGKTTLFKMICAYDQPTSGNIQVAGFNLNSLNEKQIPFLRRRIGVVFQDFRLLNDRSVFENVALPLHVLGERAPYIQKRVCEILEQVGLNGKEDQLPTHLSGGEQQRVAIARALVHRPGLLIADEPTGNLDPELSYEIMELFERVNAQGTTVVIATHDYELLERYKKRHIHIERGELAGGQL